MPRVFVTDALQRKSLPVVQSLGRKGIQVVVGDSHPWGIARFSRYCCKQVIYPPPEKRPQEFIQWLVHHLQQENYDALFPIDDRTLDPLTPHLEELSRYTRIPVVDHSTYEKARDKGVTLQVALHLGIDIPKTLFIEDEEEVKKWVKNLDYPVVIKPRKSQGSRGIRYVHSPEELVPAYREVHREHPFPLIQERIPPEGYGVGVELLLNRQSELRAFFVHKRLREYPIGGGPSTLRESIWAPDLVEQAYRLLKAIQWYGVAMVEFKVDPRDQRPKLMEINPRFWGSLELAIHSGVDFPFLLYRLALEGDIEPVHEYKIGVQSRWLLGDLLHFLSNPRRFQLQPSFFQFRKANLYYDALSWDDLGPFGGMFLSYFLQFFRGKWRDLFR